MSKKRDKQIFEQQKFTSLLSPKDDRDFNLEKVSKLIVEFPEEYESKQTEILNQGQVGSCVAHSCASTMMTCEEHSVEKHNNYSRGYIYANRRDTDYQGEGMYPRQALKQLNKCGDVLYDDFPYNIEYPEIKQKLKGIEDELAEKASEHKIVNYYRCYTNDDIKSTIINRGACIICVPVYENFGRDLEKPEGKLRGYHAMTIIGWTKDYWIVQNSWGKNWGYKGKLHMSYDYPWDEAWGMSVTLDNINPVPERTWLEKLILIIKNWFKNLFKKK